MTEETTTRDQHDDRLDLPAGMFRSGDSPEPVILAMYKPGINDVVNAYDLSFTDVGGNAIFEGDILLGTVDEVRACMDEPRSMGLGIVAIAGQQFRWKDGVVAYEVVPALRERVAEAIAHWEEHTPFRFNERTNEEDYISFEQLDGCYSRVGRQGGKQVISLASTCSLGSAIHEIGHALGLWHEQSRADRDDHITIKWDNIHPNYVNNFAQHILDGEDLGDYDFGSIMHYPSNAFAVDKHKPTIVTRNGESIGQRNGLSRGDISAIQLMYPDLDWEE